MTSPPRPPTLSDFTTLPGGESVAIAAGSPLVTLGAGATWWDKGTPVSVALPAGVTPEGARWIADGTLLVGLGTLDLATRSWRAIPALTSFNQLQPGFSSPVRQVAWLGDGAHVAILLETGNPPNRPAARRQEVVIATRDGRARGRLEVEAVTDMVAATDRVLVSGTKLQVLDLDARVIATLPGMAVRASEGAGMFAVTRTGRHEVTLVRADDGAAIAAWDVAVHDAVPVPHGVVAVDFEGTVRVGCVADGTVREVASVPSGAKAPIIRLVGDRIVLAGGGPSPVQTATFTNPCR